MMVKAVRVKRLEERHRADKDAAGFQDAEGFACHDKGEPDVFKHSDGKQKLETLVPEGKGVRIGPLVRWYLVLMFSPGVCCDYSPERGNGRLISSVGALKKPSKVSTLEGLIGQLCRSSQSGTPR